tara:strand:+ start:6118 stop:6231 length:114 start_codon:yes stop_codon:yes gene_type:complete
MTIASSDYIAKKVDGSLFSLNIRIEFPELNPASNGMD